MNGSSDTPHSIDHGAVPRCRPRTQARVDVSADLVGWAASGILLLTLCRQVYTQAQDEDAKGVSRWLFLGQIAASIGFVVYSWLVENWVFIFTNSAILITAVVGQVVVARQASKA